MRLVIDANILIAALLKDAATREILFEEGLEFFAPEHLLSEINKVTKIPSLRKRIHISNKDLSELISIITSRITFIPENIFLPFIKQSISLVSHIEDAPYIALSLSLKISLWSNDSVLKEQTKVKVYTTSEIIKFINL